MKKLIFALIALTIVTKPVLADSGVSGQYGQYGGSTPAESLIVDKMVSRGTTTKGGIVEYVDNYSPEDTRFAPGQKIYFQIKVKNTSNVSLQNVKVTDQLPEYIDASGGPGNYDPKSRTINWTYATVQAGEERIERITANIKPQAQLPGDKGVWCVTNKAVGRTGNTSDEDQAQFCIEKQVALTKGGVPTQAPAAGPEMGIALAALNLAGLTAGIYLKRKI